MRLIEANIEQITKFNLLMNEIKKLIPKINEAVKLFYVKDEVKKELEKIKSDFEYKLKRNPNYSDEYFSKIETEIDRVNRLLDDIANKRSSAVNEVKQPTNYQQRLDNGENTDKVFEDFYNTELKNVDVHDIKAAIIEECLSLGFNEATNPFITFLKNYVSKNKINKQNYYNLHNMYIDGVVTDEMLKNRDILHLLYNASFYGLPNKEQEYILNLYDKLSDEYDLKRLKLKSEIKDLYNFDNQQDIITFLNDIFAANSTLEYGEKASGDLSRGIARAERIQNLIDFISENSVNDNKKVKQPVSIQNMIKNLGITHNNYKDIMLAILFDIHPNIKDTNEQTTLYNLPNSINNYFGIIDVMNDLDSYDINENNYKDILKGIYNYFNNANK